MLIEELDAKCEEYVTLLKKKDELAETVKANNKAISALMSEIIRAMESFDKEEYSGNFGKFKVMNPKKFKVADKEAAWAWLREIGAYDKIASVHAGTFTSFVKEQQQKLIDEAKDIPDPDERSEKLYEAETWCPPGVEDASHEFQKIKVSHVKKEI